MGAWSASVTGNDTAQDLKSEYTAAFYAYDVPEALEKIEAFARKEIDPEDENEWCDYVYSLADFMWRKGILTDEVKQRALDMADSGFGLEIWAEEGKSALNARKKALKKFRDKILSPMPAKKKIRPNAYLKPIFNNGDLIALRLQTAGKKYTNSSVKPMSEEEFHSYDGKYILIQKIEDHISWKSAIVPEVKDHWAVFRLFDGVYDEIPEQVDIRTLKEALFFNFFEYNSFMSPLFCCESAMLHFKKRDCRVIGNYPEEILPYLDKPHATVFMGINGDHANPDSDFLAFMGWEIRCEPFEGDAAELYRICEIACGIPKLPSYTSDIEAEVQRLMQKGVPEAGILKYKTMLEKINRLHEKYAILCKRIDDTLANGGVFFRLSLKDTLGVLSLCEGRLDNFYIPADYQKNGFGTWLLKCVLDSNPGELYMDVPESMPQLIRICERAGMVKTGGADEGSVRMIRK